ncbi:hypothetical protein [Xylophilus sp. GOD-11R]|uniref:hypothetical protein n=1 Tax=Xylophilus sp. GOD-11R TaxID=3089814 RepID=UPI00298C86F2|nr:hypothetical protein [Xylophilus sp. GOD-11R]WPB58287.1 hypothetical protein R9X41_06495 [Xylophilus sp. GOD-11R]
MNEAVVYRAFGAVDAFAAQDEAPLFASKFVADAGTVLRAGIAAASPVARLRKRQLAASLARQAPATIVRALPV